MEYTGRGRHRQSFQRKKQCQLRQPAMLIRLLSILLVVVTAARSQNNGTNYGFLPACAGGSSVDRTIIFLFFNSSCVCTVTSSQNYTIRSVYPDDFNIYIQGHEASLCNLRTNTSCKKYSGDNSVSLESDVDGISARLVAVEGEQLVTATCTGASTTTSSTSPTGNSTDDNHTQSSEESTTTTSTTTPKSSPADDTSDSNTHSTRVSVSPARNNETTLPAAAGNTSKPGGIASSNSAVTTGHGATTREEKKMTENNESVSTMSMVVLAVGGVLFVLAATVAILSALWYRQEKRRRDAGPPERLKRRGDRTRDAQPHGQLGTSKASLLEQHDYEDVSEDGVSGVSGTSVGFVISRSSKQQPVPQAPTANNYSRVAGAPGHARQASGGNMSVSSHRAERGEAAEGGESDDYNKLNLQASARGNDALTVTAAPADTEDDDYMEIAGDDIYEAVDDDGTPLCPRKALPPPVGAQRPPREEYTDCVSIEGLDQCQTSAAGDAQVIFIGKKKKQQPVGEGSKASQEATAGGGAKSPVAQPTPKARSRKPSPPAMSPPASSRHSKSAEDLTSDRQGATRSSGKHKHTKSVDLIHPNYQNAAIFPPGSNPTITGSSTAQPKTPSTIKIDGETREANSEVNPNPNTYRTPPNITNGAPATSLRPHPSKTAPGHPDDLPSNTDKVVLRPKSRAAKSTADGPSLVEHLRATNLELLAFQEAVRSSMELNDEELVMIDNVLYGTLPRNMSLPTTEL